MTIGLSPAGQAFASQASFAADIPRGTPAPIQFADDVEESEGGSGEGEGEGGSNPSEQTDIAKPADKGGIRKEVPQFADDDEEGSSPTETDTTAEVKDAKGSAVKPEKKDESDWLTQELIDEAARHDMSVEDARDLGSAERLARVIAKQDKLLANLGRKSLANQTNNEPPAAKPEAKAETKPEAKEPEAQISSEAIAQAAVKIPDDLLDSLSDEAKAVVTNLADQFNGGLSKLADRVAAFEKTRQSEDQVRAEQSRKAWEQEMDGFFNDLGEEYQDVFGKGTLAELAAANPDSPAVKHRIELSEEMRAIAAGDASVGRPLDSYANLRKRALRSLHPEKMATKVRQEITQEVKTRKDNAIARPGGSHAGKKAGIDIAAEKVEAKYRAKGALSYDEAEPEV